MVFVKWPFTEATKSVTYRSREWPIEFFLFSIFWECLITSITLEASLPVPLLFIYHMFWICFLPGEPENFFLFLSFQVQVELILLPSSKLLSASSRSRFLPCSIVCFLLSLVQASILIHMLWIVSFVCVLLKTIVLCVPYFRCICGIMEYIFSIFPCCTMF